MSETTIDARRLARAIHLTCERTSHDTYLVSGGQRDHYITVTEGRCECDCPDFSIRNLGYCKHTIAAGLHALGPAVLTALRELVAPPRRLRRVA